MKIGFIGLGIMGKPMCKNLIRAGYKLIVTDHNKETSREFKILGADVIPSNKEIAEKSDIVITMLPDSPQVKDVILGENGVIEGAHKGLVLIDMSSISPIVSKKICEKLEEKGADMLDAPVSGGEPKAIDGSLSVMAGGKKEVFDKCYSILKAMAASVIRVGEIGAGNTCKLANQTIVAVNIAAMSEALVLAQKSGVSPELVYNAIRGGLAGSAVLDAKAPLIMDRKFDPGFKLNLHIKDLNNVLETSHQVGACLPLTSMVFEMMETLKAEGCENEDHGSLIKFYEKLANTEVHR